MEMVQSPTKVWPTLKGPNDAIDLGFVLTLKTSVHSLSPMSHKQQENGYPFTRTAAIYFTLPR